MDGAIEERGQTGMAGVLTDLPNRKVGGLIGPGLQQIQARERVGRNRRAIQPGRGCHDRVRLQRARRAGERGVDAIHVARLGPHRIHVEQR